MGDLWDEYAPGLAAAFTKIGKVEPLEVLDEMKSDLSVDDRITIVRQAQFCLENIYAHLPLKRVRHSLDPVRALELLSHQLDDMSDRDFHTRMMGIFNGLGDIHTSYRPPPPNDRMIAFLPFLVERYFPTSEGSPSYVVSRLLAGFTHESFKPGVDVTSWNGVPIHRAVMRRAEASAGSNFAAEQALAIQYLTIRWLGSSVPPDERWVVIGYQDGTESYEIRLPWALLTFDPSDDPHFEVGEQAIWLLTDTSEPSLNSCINVRTHVEHVARRRLFAIEKVAAATEDRDVNLNALKKLARVGLNPTPLTESPAQLGPVPTHIPQMFEPSVMARGNDRYGYIRIRGFQWSPEDDFVAEFRRLLGTLPSRGLILDIRGNPGGIIQCAERILQFLTPKEVTPLGFQFIGSLVTETLTDKPPKGTAIDPGVLLERAKYRKMWGASIDVALETGALYSKSVPLTDPGEANSIGQQYYGPVLLITDAITYSSGDMFAAGFQDLDIGPILGVDPTTGAGGANLWGHAQLVKLLPDVAAVEPLPGDVNMTFAVRRCLRGGDYAGMPIEELGVHPDLPRYLPTRRDVLHSNEDLLDKAMDILHGMPHREFEVLVSAEKGSLQATIAGVGVDRVDVYVDGRPLSSREMVAGSPLELGLEAEAGTSHEVTAQGFSEGDLVATSRQMFPAPSM